jgi:hypothetical protein
MRNRTAGRERVTADLFARAMNPDRQNALRAVRMRYINRSGDPLDP